MTIAGLWRGAAWTFVVFGAAHGSVWRKRKRKLPLLAARSLTLAFIVGSFVVLWAHSPMAGFAVAFVVALVGPSTKRCSSSLGLRAVGRWLRCACVPRLYLDEFVRNEGFTYRDF